MPKQAHHINLDNILIVLQSYGMSTHMVSNNVSVLSAIAAEFDRASDALRSEMLAIMAKGPAQSQVKWLEDDLSKSVFEALAKVPEQSYEDSQTWRCRGCNPDKITNSFMQPKCYTCGQPMEARRTTRIATPPVHAGNDGTQCIVDAMLAYPNALSCAVKTTGPGKFEVNCRLTGDEEQGWSQFKEMYLKIDELRSAGTTFSLYLEWECA